MNYQLLTIWDNKYCVSGRFWSIRAVEDFLNNQIRLLRSALESKAWYFEWVDVKMLPLLAVVVEPGGLTHNCSFACKSEDEIEAFEKSTELVKVVSL